MADTARIIKIVTASATLLTALAMLGFTVFALTIPHWGLFVPCFLLTIAMGFFLRNDYHYFFGKKDEPKK